MAGSAALTGFHHPLVRAARALHQKKHRQERRCFLIEGPTAVGAALSARRVKIDALFAQAGRPAVDSLARQAKASGIDVHEVDERTMRALAQTREPQGVVAAARFFHEGIGSLGHALPAGRPALVLVLHDVADPGNAGTLLRSAEAFGVVALCFGERGVDPYNEKLVRSSMGSLFQLPVFLYDRWEALVDAARDGGLALLAADPAGEDVRGITVPRRCGLVVGNERRGLAGTNSADYAGRIAVPHEARVESLNVAVAGSILLYELQRGRSNDAHSFENN